MFSEKSIIQLLIVNIIILLKKAMLGMASKRIDEKNVIWKEKVRFYIKSQDEGTNYVLHKSRNFDFIDFVYFAKGIVLSKDRMLTDALIARHRDWSIESPNILLARNEIISCKSIDFSTHPVLKTDKQHLSDSFFSTPIKTKQKIWSMELLWKKGES
jgi:hypothetical protein